MHISALIVWRRKKMLALKPEDKVTCHESYPAFNIKSGVFMYGNKYCGKKHCNIILSCG